MFSRHYPHWPPGLPKTLSLPQTSLCFNLEVSARRYPDKRAFVFYGGELTYARLKAEVEALAGYLQQECGIARGDRVVLYAQNSPQFVIAYYAILRADAVVVPANPMVKAEELAHYVEDSDARVIIAAQELWTHVEPFAGRCLARCVLAAYSDYIDPATDLPVPEFVHAAPLDPGRAGVALWREALGKKLEPAEPVARDTDLAVLPYTSGTTGKPKGCILTHRNLLATTTGGLAWGGFTSEGVGLGVLPLFHLTGMQASMNQTIQLGASSVLMTRWDRDCAAQLIERYRVTSWTAITTMVVDFLANPKLARYDLSSLQRIGGGGAAMPEALAQRIEQVFGLQFVEGYGLTETAAPSHCNPMHRPKRQCGGIPFINTDARVLEVETRRECGPNEVGEIVVDGPQVFRGYWKQPKATEEAFLEHDGKRFFRTGDLGYYDDEGYFFITDRLKRMINCSGFKVWPAEVEAMLYAHPDIQEACVIGTRDAHRGETVKAVVVLKAPAQGRVQSEDIVAWAREKMAVYKAPRVVQFVEALPKTATGKIFWRKLQEDENRRAGTEAE
ncbi:MAG: long-chain fatty acid--CoA ligase [Burkholderiales bacterium]